MRLIDADALIKAIEKKDAEPDDLHNGEDWHIGLMSAEYLVWVSPTIEPERKTGKWICYDSDNYKYDEIRCSNCGKTFTVDAERWCDIGFIRSDLKFCPNCGVPMEEGERS